jgi:hypothetical protein
MHATKNLKTTNPRGCDHRRGHYINIYYGNYITDFELE